MENTSEVNKKFFSLSEFLCKCGSPSCDAKPMRKPFLEKLEILRQMWHKPLIPTSGQRCKLQNLKVGGAPNSQHLLGNACDFYLENEAEVKQFIELAEKAGFLGIGYGRRLVHIDDRKKYTRWIYNQ
jgi:uncharacterized protein YcbK (DUF882 family)